MSSVFDRFRQPMNDFLSIRQNPSQIGDMLLKSGKINEQQFNDIKRMQSPQQICEYLLNNNPDFQKMYRGK